MKARNLMIASAAVLALGTAAILPLVSVSADEAANTVQTTFIQKLAEKLGISVDTVQAAVKSTKTEIKEIRDVEKTAAIVQAVTDGTLSQRQADILNAIETARENIHSTKTEEDKEVMRDLTQEERKAKMDEELLTSLNGSGLNTTAEEVEAAKTAAREADIMPMGRVGRGPRGENFGGPGMRL